MDYIETKTADLRVGRLCTLKIDWRPNFPTEDGKDALVRAGTEVVILPQMHIPPSVALNNIYKDYAILSSLIPSKVNLEMANKYIGEAVAAPLSIHIPTKFMLLDIKQVDWKSIVAVGKSYFLNENILETLIALRGLKETFEFLHYFGGMQEHFVLVTCPSCGRDSIIDTTRNLYCQNPGCEYKLSKDITAAELKKRFKQDPTRAVTV
jgi:hypothetical protein